MGIIMQKRFKKWGCRNGRKGEKAVVMQKGGCSNGLAVSTENVHDCTVHV